METYPLSRRAKIILFIASLLLVSFGQPVWSWWISLLSAATGFALFGRILLSEPLGKERFWTATGWFAGVQIIQLSWMASHPYLYIYAVWLLCAWIMGMQFGLIGWLLTPARVRSVRGILALAGLWTLMEWSRLFILSGFSFNPVGLALTGALYPLQFAAIGGVYLLSFWVILTNLLALRAWMVSWTSSSVLSWAVVAALPYVFGLWHVHTHAQAMEKWQQAHPNLSALLVQTAFPIEETLPLQTYEDFNAYILEEWRQIIEILSKEQQQQVDMVLLPEYVVPYGTFMPAFAWNDVQPIFEKAFGKDKLHVLPPLQEPYAKDIKTSEGPYWFVTNAFFVQGLSNLFNAEVVIGLEDNVRDSAGKKLHAYSAAFHFMPGNMPPNRYEKRVLVPMGEYIPFYFLQDLATNYGIQGSFTCGKGAKLFSGKVPFGASICYEETYADLMRENRVLGAEMLVNLTSDVWYPDSRLPEQHFDHARLRTVENGVPLLRACNTGVTAACDSIGRIVKKFGEDAMKSQWQSGALLVSVPTYHYQTLYARFGDRLVLGSCLIFLLTGFILPRRKGV